MTVRGYYEGDFDEDSRLDDESLEWVRSRQLIARILPPPPARIADVAGGTGPYAIWLARLGYQVTLLDLVPSHVEQAADRALQAGVSVECVQGDALELPWPDNAFDVVLLMGALYHLQDRADRLACLRQAHRVLKPGGALVAAYICRWASLFDGYREGFVADDRFAAILKDDLASGRHENPFDQPRWFTSAYFHTPEEIPDELAQTGFQEVHVLPVEGFTSAGGVPLAMRTEHGMATVLEHLAATESEPSLLGVSSHLMSLARKAGPRSD